MKYQHRQTKEIIEAQPGLACPGGFAMLWQDKEGKLKFLRPEEFKEHYEHYEQKDAEIGE